MNEDRFASLASFMGAINALLGLYAAAIVVLWFIKGSDWLRHSILPFHGTMFIVLVGLEGLASRTIQIGGQRVNAIAIDAGIQVLTSPTQMHPLPGY